MHKEEWLPSGNQNQEGFPNSINIEQSIAINSRLQLVLADLSTGEIHGESGRNILENLMKLSDVDADRKAVQTAIASITHELLTASFEQQGQDVLLMPVMRAGMAMWDTANEYFGYPETSFLWGTKEKGTDRASVIWLKQNNLDKKIVILDPIIATGDTIVQAYANIIAHSEGTPSITVLSCYAAPQGIQSVLDKTQNIDLIVGCMAQSVGLDGYLIPPTNGDMGDKLFGAPVF